jgi:o-succinylbenzoate synthase
MTYRFQFFPYQLKFRKQIETYHGIWNTREGIIIHLTDKTGKIGKGEIAPISWFGSETLEQALKFCEQQGKFITREQISKIPDQFPACQFAFESALDSLFSPYSQYRIMDYTYLLPTGEEALREWTKGWEKRYKTFKWKIGLRDIDTELRWFERLISVLPSDAKLRLDANGGLKTHEEVTRWLEIADKTGKVEFIEQPLPPHQLDEMLGFSQYYKTPLALDESVANLHLLEDCYKRGWRGVYIIKAAIIGSPRNLRHFLYQSKIDAVFSSAFETVVGRNAVIKLASDLSNPDRAVGFGVYQFA